MKKTVIFFLSFFVIGSLCSTVGILAKDESVKIESVQPLSKEELSCQKKLASGETAEFFICKELISDNVVRITKEKKINGSVVKKSMQKVHLSNGGSVLKVKDYYEKISVSARNHELFKTLSALKKEPTEVFFAKFKKFDTEFDEITQFTRFLIAFSLMFADESRILEYLATLSDCKAFRFGPQQDSILHIAAYYLPLFPRDATSTYLKSLKQIAQILGLSLDLKNKNGQSPRDLQHMVEEVFEYTMVRAEEFAEDPFFKEDTEDKKIVDQNVKKND